LFRKIVSTAILTISFAAAAPAEAKGKVYGDGVKLKTTTSIATLQATPAKYIGKKVRADGVVTGVCEKAGCWMELSDAKSGKGITFKVEDGVIVFPLTAKGRKASAEGVFEEVVLSPEEQKEHEQEAKANPGHESHHASAKGPTYRIRATGAVIY